MNKVDRFHDMVKQQQSLWFKVEELKPISKREVIVEKILNFYEYFAYLYLEGLVDEKMFDDLVLHDMLKTYETFSKQSKDYGYLTKFYKGFSKNEG